MHKCQMIYMMTVRKILSSLDGSNYSTHTHIPSKLMCYESWPTNQHWLNRYGSRRQQGYRREDSSNRRASKAFSLIVRGCLATPYYTDFPEYGCSQKEFHQPWLPYPWASANSRRTSTSFYVTIIKVNPVIFL